MTQSDANAPQVGQQGEPSPGVATTPGLMARAIGVVTSPKATFEAVVRNPKWLGMALLILLVTIGINGWFQTTEIGRQAALDQAVRGMESFGFKVNDQMYAQLEKSTLEAPAWRLLLNMSLGMLVAPVIWAAMAGLAFAIFTVMGGNARFKQVFAVLVHANVISVVGQIFSTPINYLRESTTGITNLSVFFPMLSEGSFITRFLGMVDLFMIWWVFALAIGLAVLYKRKTGGVAALLFGIYGVIALGIAAVQAIRSGS